MNGLVVFVDYLVADMAIDMSMHERREYAKLLARPTEAEMWLQGHPDASAALRALDVGDATRFTRVSPRTIGALPDGVQYVRNFLSRAEAKALMAFSGDRKQALWSKKEKEGRDTLLYGDAGVLYTYALNAEAVPDPWPPLLAQLKRQVEGHVRPARPYNVCLGNAYANGKQQFRFHADGEERGNAVPIAVLTVGAPRWFQFRRANARSRDIEAQLVLESGSLLVMDAKVHDTHVHGLPSDRRIQSPRYSYTFRSKLVPITAVNSAARAPPLGAAAADDNGN
jgi:alkylated DNA repair dioxygenase AlkB